MNDKIVDAGSVGTSSSAQLIEIAKDGDTYCIYVFLAAFLVYLIGRFWKSRSLEPDLVLFSIAGGISVAWAGLLILAAATRHLPWSFTEAKRYTIAVAISLMLAYGLEKAR